MRSKFTFCVALLVVCATAINTYAQSTLTPEIKKKMIQDIIAEKMHNVEAEDKGEDISEMARTTLSTGVEKKLSSATTPTIEEAETSIIVDPTDTNNIVLSYMSQSSTGLSFPIYYSSNGGTNWTKSTFNTQTIAGNDFHSGLISGGGDPVFAWDKVTHTLYFGWIYLVLNSAHDTSFFTLNWAYSNDNGKTWKTKPGEAHFIGQGAVDISTGSEIPYKDGVCDREWFAIDNSGGPRQGTLYCAFINFAHGGECVKIKGPNDTTFGAMNLAYGGSSQLVNIETDKDGILHMSFADISTNVLYHASSSDGTGPYSGPHKIYQGNDLWGKAGVVHDRENSAPSLAVDGSGNLFVAWSDFKAGKAYGYYSRSTNHGVNWSTPKRIDSLSPAFKGKMMFMPTIAASQNGIVSITVTGIDSVSKGDSARVYQLVSYDNGQTFNQWPVLLSSLPTYYPQYTPISNFFFGDYNRSVSSNCVTYAIWEDGRKTQGPKVYMATTNHCTTTGTRELSAIASSLQLSSVYPNPVSNQLNLDFTDTKSETITVLLTDMSGKVVATNEYKTHEGQQIIQMQVHANTGMYVLSVNNEEGLIATRNVQVIH